MPLRLLRPDAYRTMPWKNGLGSTTELAISPTGAALTGGSAAAFDWRVSMADLTTSGPFSTFPGVERVILQVTGRPMSLRHAGRGDVALLPLAPYRFRGEWPTEGLLAGGDVRDFNVMTRDDACRAWVETVVLAPPGRLGLAFAEGDALVHVLAGRIIATSPSTTTALVATAGDSLLAAREVGGVAALTPGSDAPATLIVVRLQALSA